MTKNRQRWIAPTIFLLSWVITVSAGFFTLWGYETAAGAVRRPDAALPQGVLPARAMAGPVLIMMVHPDCPCSRASLSELEQLQVFAQGRLAVYVIFAHPVAGAPDPASCPLWKNACSIPGVRCVRDPDGSRCRALHATISGQVFLYDDDGIQRFTGGITSSRGHEGDNEGLYAIESFLSTGQASRSSTPVYGCTLN